MKITEYERGHQDATRKAITRLHSLAREMNDPRARRMLNNAAFGLGVQSRTEAARAKVAAKARERGKRES